MRLPTIMSQAAWLWYDTDADHRAASVAYYAPLALLPLMFISVTVASVVFPRVYVVTWFENWERILGADAVLLLEQSVARLADATYAAPVPLLTTVLFSSIIVVALNVLTTGLHQLWGIPHRGVRGWLEKCFRSVAFVFVFQVYLVGWLGLYGFVHLFPGAIERWLLFLCAVVATVTLCSLAYTILPWRAPSWRGRVWGGVGKWRRWYNTYYLC